MSNEKDFVIENGVLTKYKGKGGDVVIPEGVKSIGEEAFKHRSALTSVVIPEGVTSIGGYAFYGCSALTSVVIPQSVTSIGLSAFGGYCALTDIVIPEGVKSIGQSAFSYCRQLTSIVIPEGVKSIGGDAFYGCSALTSVVIPEGVKSIGRDAFSGFEKLRIKLPINVGKLLGEAVQKTDTLRIDISDISALPVTLRVYAALCFAEDGGLPTDPRFESHAKYIKLNAEKLMNTALQTPSLLSLMCREKLITAKHMDAYIDAVHKAGNAELIAMVLDYFQTKVTVKEKERAEKQKEKQDDTIFQRALARANNDGITGLNFVVSGYLNTFESRTEFETFLENKGAKLLSSISAKVDYLVMNNAGADREKKKKAESLGIEVITEYQFNEKANRLFEIDSDGTLVMYGGDRDVVTIPVGVTSIGASAFRYRRSLTSVVIPEGVKSIGEEAFKHCSALTSVLIPEGVTSIGRSAFYGCSALTSVVIPEGVTSIEWSAFSGCSSLTSIVIPDSVTSIGNQAFRWCKKLVDANGFVIVSGTLYSYYGKESDIAIPEGVTSIGDFAFSGCSALTSIVIPDSVTSIGEDAFSWCSALTSIVIHESVTSIGKNAFSGCQNLTIHAPQGSYAEKYAKENNITFVAE